MNLTVIFKKITCQTQGIVKKLSVQWGVTANYMNQSESGRMLFTNTKLFTKLTIIFMLVCSTSVSAQSQYQKVGYLDVTRVFNESVQGQSVIYLKNQLQIMQQDTSQIQHQDELTAYNLKLAAINNYNQEVVYFNQVLEGFRNKIDVYAEKVRVEWRLSQVYKDISNVPAGSQPIDITDTVIGVMNLE